MTCMIRFASVGGAGNSPSASNSRRTLASSCFLYWGFIRSSQIVQLRLLQFEVQLSAQRLAPAKNIHLHFADGYAKFFGDLLVTQTFKVMQHRRHALWRWQTLQRLLNKFPTFAGREGFMRVVSSGKFQFNIITFIRTAKEV